VAEVEVEVEPEINPAEVEPEPVIAAAETMLPEPTADLPVPESLVGAISWEADTRFELEPEPVVAEVEPEPEPIVAEVEPEPEPIVAEVEVEVEPEPEPVVAEVEPVPEPQVELPAPTPIRPISETILPIPRPSPPMPADQDRVAASAADDPETAARRAKLELLGLGDPGEGAVGPERRPVMPYRSSGAAVHPVELSAHQSAQAGGAGGTFWEASAREVAGAVTQIGVQSCGHCGLSLSASARFCRRCGERQARSA
jgi:ribosomal protein L40E